MQSSLPISCISVLALTLSAAAQDINISDANAFFQQNIEASNTAIYPGGSVPDLMICDPNGDPLGVSFTSRWCYRVEGDAREFIFSDGNGQATYNNTGNVATVDWRDVDARGLFSARQVLTIKSTGPTSGRLLKAMTITNIGGAPLTLHMYHFQDIDACGGAYNLNSSTTPPGGRRMPHATTCGETAEHFAPGANAWETQCSGDLYSRFGDNAIITLLNNTGMVGACDVRTAFGWEKHVIPAKATRTYHIELTHNIKACGAYASKYGEHTPTSLGQPKTSVISPPVMGGNFQIDGGNLVGGSTAFHIIGFQEANIPFLNLHIYTLPVVSVGVPVNAAGQFSSVLPVPVDPGLCDFAAYSFFFFLDAASPNGLGGQSEGFAWNIGN